MPSVPRNYQPVPYAGGPAHVPNYSTLGELLGLKARNSQQGWQQLASVFNQFVQTKRAEKAAEIARADELAKLAAAEKIRRDEMAARADERLADRKWQQEQFRNTQADAAADVMVPGQPVSPAEYQRRFAGTASEVRFRHQPALAERLPARAMADVGGVPGYATPRPEEQPFEVMQRPSMSSDVAARPEQYTRAPLFAESMAVDAAQRQREAAAATAERAARDDTRADAALKATEAYRTATLAGQAEMRRIAQQNADTAKANADARIGSGTGALSPAYRNALERVLINVPANRRGPRVAQANRLWEEQNESELKDFIRQSAIEGENVDTKNQVLGRAATLASLRDTRAILTELKAKGVPTGFLTGTVEDVARRLGKTTNPEYVALSNRLMGTLINYRRAATGVAFSARESADYQRMFPNYRNELPVNFALLDGLEREMTTYDREYWKHKLGEDGAALILGTNTPTRKVNPNR